MRKSRNVKLKGIKLTSSLAFLALSSSFLFFPQDDENLEAFVNKSFGGLEKLKVDILYDFFRSAFDGSGADNFYDAGSCVDGRLTSAWNWCQQLQHKEFYVIFKLTGFVGFDGDFSEQK